MVNSKEYMKAYYLNNKDKLSKNHKAYNQTYKGIRRSRITTWKQTGIIIDDYHNYYDTVYMLATHCDKCHVEFSEEAKKSTTKNLDHDHQINDRPNVRNILCSACNSASNRQEMATNNTSGHANIQITKWNTYEVRIMIRKKTTSKNFKTLSEAIEYRDFIKNNI